MLEKSTYVPTQSNGRIEFKRSDDGSLRVELLGADGNVTDSAQLGEDDLRSLLKDFFPTKRGPRQAKAGKAKQKAAA